MHNKIISQIKRDEIIELLSLFVRTPSVSGDEAKLAKIVADICIKLGLDTKIDRHGNVIATLKGNKPGPRIALNSHLDTVGYGEGWTKDPLGAEIDGDRLYGRGSCDCKSSMVCHILATKALIESGVELAGEIVITHVVEEEVQNEKRKGTYKLLEDGFKADMAINGEAIDMQIGLACNGMAEVEIKTFGKRAHGATPEAGINAIHSMVKVIQELNKLEVGYHKYTGRGSLVPGVINGGERSSVVPDECTLKVSRFLVPGESGEAFYAEVQQILEKLKQEDSNFQATVELTYNSKPALTDENELIVQSMVKAFEFLNIPWKFGGTPQHDDADYLVNKGNIPTVIFGPGKIMVGHIPDEYVDISEVVTATKIYALTLYNALKA